MSKVSVFLQKLKTNLSRKLTIHQNWLPQIKWFHWVTQIMCDFKFVIFNVYIYSSLMIYIRMVPIHWFLFIKWKRKRAWVLVIGALRSLSQNSGQERFHFVLPLQIKVGTTTKSCSNFEIDTMESSLFMGDECSRLLWVTFSLKFTSQRMYIQALNCFILFKINLNLLPMHKITSPWTRKSLATHELGPPQIKMIL